MPPPPGRQRRDVFGRVRADALDDIAQLAPSPNNTLVIGPIQTPGRGPTNAEENITFTT